MSEVTLQNITVQELKVSMNLVNDRLHFIGKSRKNEPLSIDYVPPQGDNLGYTSLELLLFSFASCVSSTVLPLLRKMQKTINGFESTARGIRRETHPTSFEKINLELILKSPDTVEAEFEKLLKLAEEKYCPVWDMIKNNTEVSVDYKIIS
jgi:putative redox protein